MDSLLCGGGGGGGGVRWKAVGKWIEVLKDTGEM